jgi:RimJ/RimL family protein N-acetyltransferase
MWRLNRLSPACATSTLALVLSELWPTYALRIHTPRLTLRLPDENELAALARVVANGVHKPNERPFLTPWTEGTPEDRARTLLQSHWDHLASWTPANWTLGLGVFLSGKQPIGMVTLRAGDFRVVREVSTTSWLGLAHHHQGFGTEARAGLLTLAFDHLGATDATTEVFPDNHASQGVSRKLGYLPDGISKDARGDEVLVSDRLRLNAARWAELSHPPVSVEGVQQALTMFLG